MKLFGTIVIILFSFFVVVGFLVRTFGPQLPPEEQLVNSTLNKTAKIIKNKYNIKPSGEGAAMPEGPIKKLLLAFDTKEPYTKEVLRDLVIKCANELVDQVHANEEIQQYLAQVPFTIKHVQIIIYNHDTHGREVCDPGISTAQISRDRLTFRSVDPDNVFRYKSQSEETYEEALKILQETGESKENCVKQRSDT